MQSYFFKRDANYDQAYGNKDWLYINNFGFYRNISKDISISREVPRADYHLLYVANGEVLAGGMTLKSGDSYLFVPNEPQTYTYKQTDSSLYYWIHFTGNQVPNLLSKNRVSKGFNPKSDRTPEKNEMLAMLLAELGKCAGEPSNYAVALLFSFFALFEEGQSRAHLYRDAIRALENMAENASIASIAKRYNVCPAHFIRSFKSAYGMTPNEYKQNHRRSHAMNLLKMTNLSIQDVAQQCGFEDSFYFSRFFKKAVGVSPSAYRKL